MVHQPSAGYQGQATDIEIHANEIMLLKKRLNEIYSKHTGRTVEEIKNALERDKFMTPQEAKEFGLPLYFEAFSDRRYTDDGLLQSRNIEGAVLDEKGALMQAEQLIESGTVTTASGNTLKVEADSLCVHGDTLGAVSIAQRIRAFL